MSKPKDREALTLILGATAILAASEVLTMTALAPTPGESLSPDFRFNIPLPFAIAAFFLFRWCYERVPGKSLISKSLVFALAMFAVASGPSDSIPIEGSPATWLLVALALQSILAYGLVIFLFARSASRSASQRQIAAA
jgi:hypothetical protein